MGGLFQPVGKATAIVVLATFLALFGGHAVTERAGATVPAKACGKIKVNGKPYRVKAHRTKCRFARNWSKKVLRGKGGPAGWSCRRFPARKTRIAFVCRKAGKDFFAIRK